MDSNSIPSEMSFINIKNILLQVNQQIQNSQTSKHNIQGQIEFQTTISSLNNELSSLRMISDQRQERVVELQLQLQLQNKQNHNKYKKEIRSLVDLVNEKDNELQRSKKTNSMQKDKISALQQDLQNLASAKVSLQNTICKSLQFFKSSHKEMVTTIEDSELDRIVLQNKYKQIQQKIEHQEKVVIDIQMRKRYAEENYQKLRENYKKLQNQNIQLQFAVEKHKSTIQEMKSDMELLYQKNKNSKNKIFHEDDDFEDEVNHSKNNRIVNKMDNILKIMTIQSQKKEEIFKVSELNNICNELTEQNRNLKDQIAEKQGRIEKMLIEKDGENENQIMKQRNPSLYEELLMKKQKIQEFERDLANVVEYIKNNEQRIQQTITNAEYMNPKIREMVQEVQKTNKKFQVLEQENKDLQMKMRHYKLQLYEMIQAYEIQQQKGKNNKGKKKKKARCSQCLFGAEQGDLKECQNCRNSIHEKDCSNVHYCQEIKKGIELDQSQFE